MHAAMRCEAAVIAEALACGADIAHVDHQQRNALHVACEEGHAAAIPLLVKAGCRAADADAAGFTAVERALLAQSVDCSYALYLSGALFTKRQLLLLGVLLRESSLLRCVSAIAARAATVRPQCRHHTAGKGTVYDHGAHLQGAERGTGTGRGG